jgi:hypothetical protein
MTFDRDHKVIKDDKPSVLVFHSAKFIKKCGLIDLDESKLFVDISLKSKRLHIKFLLVITQYKICVFSYEPESLFLVYYLDILSQQ